METLKVEQCDRDAAYGAYFECYEDTPNDLWLESLRAGMHDDDPQVQVIAAVCIAERERNAGKCDERAALYRAKAGKRDALADDSLNEYERFIGYAEVADIAAQAIRAASDD